MKHFLAFTLEKHRYGVDLYFVLEVIYMVALIPLPSMEKQSENSSVVLGLVNVRGQVMPVFSLRRLFGFSEDRYTRFTRIILVQIKGTPFGLAVDSVEGVKEGNPENFKAFETRGRAGEYSFISHLYQEEDRVFLIINANHLLSQEEIRVIKNIED